MRQSVYTSLPHSKTCRDIWCRLQAELISGSLEGCKRQLTEIEQQAENAQAEVDQPFAQEEELKQKSSRLDELDRELDIGKPDVSNLVDEQEIPVSKREPAMVR